MGYDLTGSHVESLCFDCQVSCIKVLKIAVPIGMVLGGLAFVVFQNFYMQAKINALERIAQTPMTVNVYMEQVAFQIGASAFMACLLSIVCAILLERRKQKKRIFSDAIQCS